MTETEITDRALDALGKLLAQMATPREKSDAISLILIAGYNMLRSIEGDEFVRGWLESALADVKNCPPAFVAELAKTN